MRAKYLLCSAGIIVAFCITGCDGRREQDAKTDPNQYCFPFYKETGEAVEYIDAGETKRTTQFLEYQTAAGFKMRILRGTGGLGHPNKQCQVETGGFSFRWANGRLMPRWDYKTGKRNTEGSLVEYFVRFHPPSQRLAEKFDYPEWMFEGAFRIPGHERVVVMPFAGYANAQGIPADRNNRSLWRPRLLLEDARGPADSFNCGPLSNEEKDGELHVSFKNFRKNASKCMGGLQFGPGATGRFDIYDEDFFGQGAAITNAVINELNS
jgi:hypothetical protein